MMPISISPSLRARLTAGRVVALNVGAPPAVSARIYVGSDDTLFEGVDLGEAPDFDKVAVIGAAVTADGQFVDLVWISEAALANEVKQ